MTRHTLGKLRAGAAAGLCLAWLVTTGCSSCNRIPEDVGKLFKNIKKTSTPGIYVGSYASTGRSVVIQDPWVKYAPLYVAGQTLKWTTIPQSNWTFIAAPPGYTFNSEGECVAQGTLAPAAQPGSSGSAQSKSPAATQSAQASLRYAPQSAPLLYKAGANTATVVVLDPSTNTVVGTVPVGTHPRGVAGTPDGKQVWVANRDSSSISVIATSTLTVVGTITLPSSQPYGIAITPDGTTAYVANGNATGGAVYVVNVAKQSLTATIPVGGRPFKLAISPDGGQVWVTNNADGTVSVIDVLTNTIIKTMTVDLAAFGIAFAPNGTRVYVTANGLLYVIDPSSYQILAKVAVGVYPVSVTVDSTGTEAFVCNRLSTFISHVDLTTNQVIENIDVGFAPETATLLP